VAPLLSAQNVTNVVLLEAQGSGVATWNRDVPLHENLRVQEKGVTRDGKGHYLRGVADGNMRELYDYYNQEMAALGWASVETHKAPGGVMRMGFVRGQQTFSISLSATRNGTIVLMSVGRFNDNNVANIQ